MRRAATATSVMIAATIASTRPIAPSQGKLSNPFYWNYIVFVTKANLLDHSVSADLSSLLVGKPHLTISPPKDCFRDSIDPQFSLDNSRSVCLMTAAFTPPPPPKLSANNPSNADLALEGVSAFIILHTHADLTLRCLFSDAVEFRADTCIPKGINLVRRSSQHARDIVYTQHTQQRSHDYHCCIR